MNGLYALEANDQDYSSYSKPKTPHRITEAEYWETYYEQSDVIYEWHDGELEEKPLSNQLTISTYAWFSELLGHYLRTQQIAQKTSLEMGFRLVLPHKTTIRKPDVAIVLDSNPVPLLPDDNSYQGTFDLCIEALSDSAASEIERDTITKKGEYAQAGVKEYYILYGKENYTEFYRLNKRGKYTPIRRIKGDIIRSTVLPGFQFRVSDLFKKPLPDEMIDDPVYQGFVLPGYSEAKKRAEAEAIARKKAEQRADALELVNKKAEAEIARLKALLASQQ